MTDHTKLLERLRTAPPNVLKDREAADAITALQAEVATLAAAGRITTDICAERDAALLRVDAVTEVASTLRHALSNVLQHAPKDIWPKWLEIRDKCDAVLYRQGEPACQYCDGTGDVHTPTGEWRGVCTECAVAGASPAVQPTDLQAENDKLIAALAACRDAFPVPDAGSRLDDWYCTAMADPLEVPDYVKACVGASPVQPSNALQVVARLLRVHEDRSPEDAMDLAAAMLDVQPSQALELSDKNEPPFAWWCESSDCITRSSHVLNNWITKGIKAIPLYK